MKRGRSFPDSEICTVDMFTGRITSIGGLPWPPQPESHVMQLFVEKPTRILRRYTFGALSSIVALQGAWKASEQLQVLLPAPWVQGITLVLAGLGVIGAFIDQPATHLPKE